MHCRGTPKAKQPVTSPTTSSLLVHHMLCPTVLQNRLTLPVPQKTLHIAYLRLILHHRLRRMLPPRIGTSSMMVTGGRSWRTVGKSQKGSPTQRTFKAAGTLRCGKISTCGYTTLCLKMEHSVLHVCAMPINPALAPMLSL